jgi:hypothetical protein
MPQMKSEGHVVDFFISNFGNHIFKKDVKTKPPFLFGISALILYVTHHNDQTVALFKIISPTKGFPPMYGRQPS